MNFPLAAKIAIAHAYRLPALETGQRVSERVWRWTTDSGEIAVKTFDTTERARGAQEAALISFLGERPDPACRVQTLVTTEAGAPWLDDGGRRIVVTRWEAGEYRPYDCYADVEWAALGRCLATLHRRLEQPGSPHLETLSHRLAGIDAGIELQQFTAAADAALPRVDGMGIHVQRYVSTCRDLFTTCHPRAIAAFPVEDPQHPIHNDFNQFNYLFDGTLPPLILDWESSIGAPREFEVVRCLNHLPLQRPALAHSFLSGYLGVRSLRAGRMRWAVDAACLMHATKHWVLRGWIEGRPGYDERLRGAMEMVSMLARDRESLIDFFVRHVEDAA